MIKEMRAAILMLVMLSLITGVLYPLFVTGVSQGFFPGRANGSLITTGEPGEKGARVRGSELVGQFFDGATYFWSRPSATSPVPYNASASSGSNLGPINPALTDALKQRIEKLRALPGGDQPIPADLVTSSASGLDPHISPASAYFQVARVALARGFSAERVRSLVQENVEDRTFAILGEPHVNVLRLNLALDRLR